MLAVIIATTLHTTTNAQSLSVNTTGAVADPSAILDVTSTAKGILIPRMDKTEKNAIATPANGLMIFQTGPDSIGFHYYDLPNTQWVFINTNGFANDTTAWKLTGNSNVADTSFLGSINNKALKFRVYDTTAGIVDSTSGNTGLGYKSLRVNTLAGFYANTAMGFGSGQSLSVGFSNTVMGRHSLSLTGVSERNVAIGDSAMGRATSIGGTTAVGYQALKQINGLSFYTYNTAVGYASQSGPTGTINGPFSYYNTSLGGFAMADNMAGYENVAVGVSALRFNDSSAGNTAIGMNAMAYHNRSGYAANTAVGGYAMENDSISNWNTAIGSEALRFNKNGSVNTALGFRSMRNHKTGGENTALGVGTLEADSSGTQNTAVGRSALFLNKAGTRNTVVGAEAGVYNNYSQSNPLQGSENTYVGFNSGRLANLGRKNAVVGAYALEGSGLYGDLPALDAYSRNSVVGDSAALRTFGNDNVAMGFKALNSNTGGSQHVAIGSRALAKTTSGYPNTAVGYSSMDSTTNGYANTALGSFTLTKNKLGFNNTAIGNAAMFEADNTADPTFVFDNTAVGNDALRFTRYYGHVAVGAGALRNDTSGTFNTAVGYLAMYNNLSGNVNTALGTSALRSNTTGVGNTTLGVNAMYNHKINDMNTAVGYESMISDTAGSLNTAVGWRSLRYVLAGSQNTAIGVGTLEFTDSATGNTAVGRGAMIGIPGLTSNLGYNTVMGYYAGAEMDSVEYSTAIGFNSGYRNKGRENTFVGANSGVGPAQYITGIENTGLGSWSLWTTTTGYSNTAVGMGSLMLNGTGKANVGVGVRSLFHSEFGDNNVAVGDSALFTNFIGSSNTALGYKADISVFNLNNASAIGSNALVAQNNSMVLGSINGINGATSDTKVGIRTTTPDSTFSVADNFLVGSSGTVQFADNVPVMNYMFKTCCANADRMVIAHSPAASNWGLQYQDGTDQFNFLGGGINRMAIELATGQIGIGIANPQKLFHVFAGTSGAVTNAASQILMEDDANSYFEMSTPVASENGILSSNINGIRSALIFRQDSSIRLRSGGNIERLIIDKNGFASFNKNPPANGISAGSLQVQNVSSSDDVLGLYNIANTANRWTYWVNSGTFNLEMYYNGVTRGNWNVGTGVYTATSDRRLKKDITDYNYGLETVKALMPYKYHYLDNKTDDRLLTGFMAQDVLKVFPEAVYSNIDKNGKQYYTMDYQSFSVLSIKAIQEQQQIIDKQQKQIDDLLIRITKLEQK